MVRPLPSLTASVRQDEDGVLRVGDTRVLLDLVVHAFDDGASCENIVDRCPSLSLANAYGAVAFYLNNREYVDEYLAERERDAQEIRRKIEASQPMTEIRRRLEARRAASEEVAKHAPRG
jgi:uncharacterized protein (DUF433 family)